MSDEPYEGDPHNAQWMDLPRVMRDEIKTHQDIVGLDPDLIEMWRVDEMLESLEHSMSAARDLHSSLLNWVVRKRKELK